MNGIPSELLPSLRKALRACPEFQDMPRLKSVFEDGRLKRWKEDLPEGNSLLWRVNLTISYLIEERTGKRGENALVILLNILSNRRPEDDGLHYTLADLASKLSAWDQTRGSTGSYGSPHTEADLPPDVVILTVLQEEYEGVCTQLLGCHPVPGRRRHPNLYAWQLGRVPSLQSGTEYGVAVGMMVRAGTSQSALATMDAIERWRPRYIFLSGIAGGFADLRKGDVEIADVIHGYEYGKIERSFIPRDDWTYKTDLGLLSGAEAYALKEDWRTRIHIDPPEPCPLKVVKGEIASGDKVIDDPTQEFFRKVLKTWPKILAVEMEGAGMGLAVEQAHALGASIGFMMIRGISDLPNPRKKREIPGAQERDKWKRFAADTAAAFTVGFISSGLPTPPRYTR